MTQKFANLALTAVVIVLCVQLIHQGRAISALHQKIENYESILVPKDRSSDNVKAVDSQNNLFFLSVQIAKLNDAVSNLSKSESSNSKNSSEQSNVMALENAQKEKPVLVKDLEQLGKSLQTDFKSYDTNGDGVLNLEETNMSPKEFAQFDRNKNGTISEGEIESTQELLEQVKDAATRRDKSDGTFPVDQENWDRNMKEFQFIDKDHDQTVTAEEYLDHLNESRAQRNRFDIDEDGKISEAELGQGKERFNYIDDDKDGYIDSSEIRRAMTRGYW